MRTFFGGDDMVAILAGYEVLFDVLSILGVGCAESDIN